MSVDELFQLSLRTAAAIAWIMVAWRRRHPSPYAYRLALFAVPLMVTAIAVGGWLAILGIVSDEAIYVAYTAVTVVLLNVAVAVWTAGPRTP